MKEEYDICTGMETDRGYRKFVEDEIKVYRLPIHEFNY